MNSHSLSRRAVLSLLAASGASAYPGFAFAEPDLTLDAFRDEVVAIGRRRLPEMHLEAGGSKGVVIAGPHTLYLQNIFQAARGMPAAAREEAIILWLAHFTPAADAKVKAVRARANNWEGAQPLLRARLMPRLRPDLAERLLHRSFVGGLDIIYTIDLGDKDLYVSRDQFSLWHVTQEEVDARAIANLEAMSSRIGSDITDRNILLNIRTSDGYDAARLILPGLRHRLLKALGTPLHAAVPVRDSFLCWPPGDAAFERRMADLVRDETREGDHPISPTVFVVDEQGITVAA